MQRAADILAELALQFVRPAMFMHQPFDLGHRRLVDLAGRQDGPSAWLGDDVESIGYEKAGIMRPGVPVVFGDTDVPQAILRHAEEIGARLLLRGRDYSLDGIPQPGLPGAFQVGNAAAVVAMLRAAGLQAAGEGVHDDDLAVLQHVFHVGWPGLILGAAFSIVLMHLVQNWMWTRLIRRLADLGDRHAKEILVADVDGELRHLTGGPFVQPGSLGEALGRSADARLVAPAVPSKIVCVGRNYVEHAAEHGRPEQASHVESPPASAS